MKAFLDVITPNHVLSKRTMMILIGAEVLLALLLWSSSSFAFLPTPKEIFSAWGDLFTGTERLGWHFISSFKVNAQAIIITAVLSLALVYLAVMPLMRPVVAFLSKWRFMGLVGFTLIFTLLTSTGHELKVALLVFGMSTWFITSFASEIEAIPQESFDHARTLGMGRWRVVWEVVVLGKADAAFEILRQNAAMGWLMLTMVEGLSRSEGGLGVLLLTQNRHMRLDKIFAIQITILLYGVLQDYFLGWMKRLFCPYADLGKGGK